MKYKFTESDVSMLRKMAANYRRDNPPTTASKQTRNRKIGSGSIKFGKAKGDIIPDTEDGNVDIWDDTVTPPVVSDPLETVDNVILDWLTDEQISDGKEVVIIKIRGRWHILWSECEDPSINLYDDGGTPPPTINPGGTERLGLVLMPQSMNTVFTIVNGNELEARIDVAMSYAMSVGTIYDASANNQEITIRVDLVVTAGTPSVIDIPLVDSFATPRNDVFAKSHSLPTGVINMVTGDRIAFDATNEASSTMDLIITAYILSLTAAGG